MAKCIIRILVNFCVVLVVRVQSFWLFGEFVDRNLADNQREILRLRLRLLMIRLRRNVRLTRQMEHSIHIVVALRILLDSILWLFLIWVLFLRLDLAREMLVVF